MSVGIAILFSHSFIIGKDFILTIAGGYEPAGNQASLEANVLFFQQLLSEKVSNSFEHQIYFADGSDEQEDLQVMAPKAMADSPSIAMLNGIFSLDRPMIHYRNHQVPDVRGPISPRSIRSGLDEMAERLTVGDRLIIYVTAHGGPADGKDPMNTSITCWRKRSISMKTFSEWLDRLPSSVPVVLVMAQCYCGGFANTIFEGGDPANGLSKAVRIGFFAQRNDLPAAGCRPDIENDEEYSSFFWGAFLGRSRTGKSVESVDCDQNGQISFEEAHAYAVKTSQTIDIPLRSSDLFLRHFSRIAGYESTRVDGTTTSVEKSDEELGLSFLTGRLSEIADMATSDRRSTIESLAKQLGLSLDTDVAEVFQQNKAQSENYQQARLMPGRRGSRRRGPRNSVRRDLLKEIVESWPELESPSDWKDLTWLRGKESETFLNELQQLPNFEVYKKSQDDRRKSRENALVAEVKDVQFRRLVQAMESIVLAQNLPRIASPELLLRYQAIVALESSSLSH